MSAVDEKDLPPVVRTLEYLRQAGREANLRMVAEAELNIAYLAGEQWSMWQMGSGLTPVENATGEDRAVDNRMLPAFLRWMNYFFKSKPTITCHEGGLEIADSESASAASTLCDYWRSNNGWEPADRKKMAWLWAAGIGYTMPYWRKNSRLVRKTVRKLGNELRKTKRGKRTFMVDSEVLEWEGDVAVSYLCPLTTYLFPLDCEEWSKVEGVLHVSLETLDFLRSNVDENLDPKKMRPASEGDLNVDAMRKVLRLKNSQAGKMMGLDAADKEKGQRYLNMQYWQRPNKEYPDGRHVLTAGGILVHDGKLPYVNEAREIDPGDAHNLTMGIVATVVIDFPGVMVPPPPGTQWRPAQDAINELKTDQRANRRSIGRNKLVVEAGTIKRGAWTDEHGELIEVDASAKIQPHFTQGLPLAGLPSELNEAYNAFDEVTGQLPAIRGRNETQVRSAMHLDILREEAMDPVSVQVGNAEKAFEMTARLLLAIAKKRYSQEQVITICGRDKTAHALAFMDARITTDIRVTTGSMMPRNHALREAMLDEKFARGAFIDAKTGKNRTDKYWEMSALGTMNQAVDPEYQSKLMASQENAMIAHAKLDKLPLWVLIPIPEQDHQIHSEEHLRFMGTERFLRLDEARQAAIRAHHEEHVKLLTEQLAPQALDNSDQIPVAGLGALMADLPMDGGAPLPAAAPSPGSGDPGVM